MGESVPVRCPECLHTQAYAAPVFPCACGSPVAAPVAAGAVAEPITHRNWADEWVTVRCGACGRDNDWPHPELGCPCGTVLRVPVHLPAPTPGPMGAASNDPGDGVAGSDGPDATDTGRGGAGRGLGAGGREAGGAPAGGPGAGGRGSSGFGTGAPGTGGPGTGRAGTGGPRADGMRPGEVGTDGPATGRGDTGHGPGAGGAGSGRAGTGSSGLGGPEAGGPDADAFGCDGAGEEAGGGPGGAAGGRGGSEGPRNGAPSVSNEAGSPWFGPGPKARGDAGRGAGRTGPTGLGTAATGPAGHGTDGAAGRGADGAGPGRPRPFAERYPLRVSPPPVAPRPVPLRGAFLPVTIRTSRDAVAAAAGYLRWLGFRDVVQPEERPSSGVDLRAPGLVAQVDPTTRPTGLRAVECLWLNGLSRATVSVFFSLAGYTPEARSRAAEVGLPLFVLDLTGTPQPVNHAAAALAAGGA